MSTIFDEIKDAIVDGDEDLAVELAERVIAEKVDPVQAVQLGFIGGIEEVGKAWTNGEAFLPDVMMAADAMKAGMDVLEEVLAAGEGEGGYEDKGKIVLGTVEGDIHDIGKNIVGALLTSAGFKVYDIGIDQKAEDFVAKADEVGAKIIAASALLTTTMKSQKTLVEYLNDNNLRDKYKIIIGGGPTSAKWGEDIGADGWAETADEAVELCKQLLA
ncbi:corrinoid protein [Acetobacterium wieringae]|jgi:trimethylamine corrinoid protein|uniref:Corrinoid protein n=1 Tax=Acetobacterium wieringae TaxID=52694 RepID=A0ABY6HCQ3_9FIRM|nr:MULTISPECIES: corrinoid protein [Acetobacterium]URN83842.1 corrinoid protein [Acetobacterium wieringae]UYO62286.1 corrinoid protein [Acetobacterium wieringae]VUZ23070.1 Methionine synthase [Acetobacterium wieringae]